MHEAFARHRGRAEAHVDDPGFQSFANGWINGRRAVFDAYLDELVTGRAPAEIIRGDLKLDPHGAFDRAHGHEGAHRHVHHANRLELWLAGWSAGVADLRAEQRAELDSGKWPAEMLIHGEPVPTE